MRQGTGVLRALVGAVGALVVAALVAALLTPAIGRSVAAQDVQATAEGAAEEAAGQAQGEGDDQGGTALVRVVHASPDAGNVDVLLDGQPVAPGVTFGSATQYLSTGAGQHQLQVVPSGQAADAALITQDVTFENGRTYIVAAVNPRANIAAQIYEVDRSPIADPNSARVRVINAAADLQGIDVGPAGGQALVQNLTPPNASPYVPVAAGSYDLEVHPTGSQDVAVAAPGTQFQQGVVYDLFVIGQAAAGNLTLFVVTTQPVPDCATVLGLGQPGGSCVRVVHAAPGAPAVDVYLDDTAQPIVTNLAFGTATQFTPFAPGDHQIRLTPTGTTVDEAIADETVSIGIGRAFDVAATGTGDDIGLETNEVDLSQVEGGQARVRFINAAPGTDDVDVRVANGPLLFDDIGFNESSEYVVVPAGSFAVEVVDQDGNVVMSNPGLQVQGNMVYDVYAIGRAEDQNLALLVLTAPAVTGQAAAATPAAAPPAVVGSPVPGTPLATPAGTVQASPVTTPTPVQVTATTQVVEVTTTPVPVQVTATPPA